VKEVRSVRREPPGGDGVVSTMTPATDVVDKVTRLGTVLVTRGSVTAVADTDIFRRSAPARRLELVGVTLRLPLVTTVAKLDIWLGNVIAAGNVPTKDKPVTVVERRATWRGIVRWRRESVTLAMNLVT